MLAGIALLASACTPAPPDDPVEPVDRPYRALPWSESDAPQVLADLSALADSPRLLRMVGRERVDEVRASIQELTEAPDAVDQVRRLIRLNEEQEAVHDRAGTVTPPSADLLEAAGAPADVVSGQVDPPTDPPPPPPTVEEPRPGAATPRVVGLAEEEGPGPLVDLADADTGRTWPEGGAEPWPVTAGPRTEALFALRGDPPPTTASADCTAAGQTGPRAVPNPVIPGYTTKVFTPYQDSWARESGTPIVDGQLQTRMDPAGTGIRQFLVEAHLMSPVIDPLTGQPALITALRPLISVASLGGTVRTFTTGSAGAEVRVLCYAQDANQTQASRGYVRAWIPMSDPADPAADLVPPGFRVKVDVVDNYWSSATPVAFYAAAQATVHLAPRPLAHDELVTDAVGVRVDDGVLVDRNGDPGDDIESLLAPRLQSVLEAALNGAQGSQGWLPVYWSLSDVDPNDIGVDLDVRPVINSVTPGFPPTIVWDDEYQVTATLAVRDLFIRGGFGYPPCFFQTHVTGTVQVDLTVDLSGDRLSIDPDVRADVRDVGTFGTFISPVWLYCNAFYLLVGDAATSALEDMADGAVSDALAGELQDPVAVNTPSVVGPGVAFASGGGFTTRFAGFNQTCVARGCQGGDVLLDADGLHLTASVGVDDRRPATAIRRFPWTYDPEDADRGVDDRVLEATTPDGRAYDLGAFVDPAVLNQFLRSITEGDGPATAPNGVLDRVVSLPGATYELRPTVAPFYLERDLLGGQPPLTLLVPDLRVDDPNGNSFAVDIAVGLDLDVVDRRLEADLTIGFAWSVLECTQSSTLIGLSWATCQTLQNGLNALSNWLGQTLVPQLVQQSLGQVELPDVAGMDLGDLGDVEIGRTNGTPSVYLGVDPASVDVALVWNGTGYQAVAAAAGLPGAGPVTYDFLVEDLVGGGVVDPPAGTSDTVPLGPPQLQAIQLPFSGLQTYGTRITVTATRNAQTLSVTRTLTFTI